MLFFSRSPDNPQGRLFLVADLLDKSGPISKFRLKMAKRDLTEVRTGTKLAI
jgi:hypothetical protein